MRRNPYLIVACVLALVTGTIVAFTLLNQQSGNRQALDLRISQLAETTTNGLKGLTSTASAIEAGLRQQSQAVNSIAARPTPTPGMNALTQQFVSGVRASDTQRMRELGEVSTRILLLGGQLNDLQRQLTNFEERFDRDIRALKDSVGESTGATKSEIATASALILMFSTLVTLGLAVRTDWREGRKLRTELEELRRKQRPKVAPSGFSD